MSTHPSATSQTSMFIPMPDNTSFACSPNSVVLFLRSSQTRSWIVCLVPERAQMHHITATLSSYVESIRNTCGVSTLENHRISCWIEVVTDQNTDPDEVVLNQLNVTCGRIRQAIQHFTNANIELLHQRPLDL